MARLRSIAKCRKNPNQSVLQLANRLIVGACLKRDELSQTVQIPSSSVRLGLGLDGPEKAGYTAELTRIAGLLFVMGKCREVYFITDTVLARSSPHEY